MAREIETVITYVDDVDGEKSSRDVPGGTVTFADPHGNLFDIDLVGPRFAEARNLLDGLIEYARKSELLTPPAVPVRTSSTRKPRSAGGSQGADRAQNQVIREWAKAHGFAVPDRGRIPSAAKEAWEAAGSPGKLDAGSQASGTTERVEVNIDDDLIKAWAEAANAPLGKHGQVTKRTRDAWIEIGAPESWDAHGNPAPDPDSTYSEDVDPEGADNESVEALVG